MMLGFEDEHDERDGLRDWAVEDASEDDEEEIHPSLSYNFPIS